VDPIYFEKTYYLGPDKGGEKAYRLLSDAMLKTGRVALAKFCMRGKESLVLIRSAQKGLMLHFMYFADEVRDFGEVDKGDDAKIKPGEMDLANRLIDELSKDSFRPDQYADEYRTRVLQAVEMKVEGQEVTSLAPEKQRTQVIDLMEALKQSLGKRTGGGRAGADGAAAKAEALEKKPAAKARREKAEGPREKKVQGGRR
jgi:DNA end-binding protein Ku